MSSKPKPLGHAPRFTARVTQDIIDHGMARNSNHCMIAEAIKRAYPKLKYISVDIQTIRATDLDKRERYVWLTPRSNQLAIINFDQGRKPKPFSFELRSGQTIQCVPTMEKRRQYKKANKATLRRPRKGSGTSVPVIAGGEAPPRSVGRRRAFGLRSLEF